MAGNSGNSKFLYFVVGALVVAVAGFALYEFGGFGKDEADIKIELPDVKSN